MNPTLDLDIWLPIIAFFILAFNSIVAINCLQKHSPQPMIKAFLNLPFWGLFISSASLISFLTVKAQTTQHVLFQTYGVVIYVAFSLSITLALLSTKCSPVTRGFRCLGWQVVLSITVSFVLGAAYMMFTTLTIYPR